MALAVLFKEGPDLVAQGVDRIDQADLRQLVADRFPDALDGVQVGRIGRQSQQVNAQPPSQCLHGPVQVRACVVPDEHDSPGGGVGLPHRPQHSLDGGGLAIGHELDDAMALQGVEAESRLAHTGGVQGADLPGENAPKPCPVVVQLRGELVGKADGKLRERLPTQRQGVDGGLQGAAELLFSRGALSVVAGLGLVVVEFHSFQKSAQAAW